jgi:hypothetical protein
MIFSCNAHGHLVATRGHPTLQTSATKNSSSNLPDNEFFFCNSHEPLVSTRTATHVANLRNH